MHTERILVVEHDPDISDLIARQTLQAMGYKVKIVGNGNAAVKALLSFDPDLIFTNLHLPDISGKDLLVAIQNQKENTPVIVIAEEGQENEVIQAFRLGANDYLFWPARDTEIAAATDRALRQVREAHEREALSVQLKETNARLNRHLNELRTIIDLGKAVVSITNQQKLFERIIDGAMRISASDIAWLLVRNEKSRQYLLVAERNLPAGWAKKKGQPLDDGVSGLVRVSGEPLLIHGKALERFKASTLGNAIAIIPIKAKREVIGLLVVMRQKEKPYTENTQVLLEAIADYAAISLVNAQLFQALEASARQAQRGEQVKNQILESLRRQIRDDIQAAIYPLELISTGQIGELTPEQKEAIDRAKQAVKHIVDLVNEATIRFGKSAK